MNPDPSLYLRVSLLIAAAGACVADLELLTLRKDIRSGMLSYGSFEHGSTAQNSRREILRINLNRFNYPITLLAICLQLLSSLLIGVSAFKGETSLTGLGIFVACGLLLRARGGLGNNGADEMIILIMVAGLLVRLFDTSNCALIVLVFLSAQLSLSYLTSGLVKVCVLHWRDGTSIVNIMGTETFGNGRLHAVLRSSPLSAAFVSSVLIFGELFGSFAPWLPRPFAISLLFCSFSFHLAAAVVMGLNNFVPAFVATYPAALYTSQILYTHHGWHTAG
jgi:hypothetical protein